MRMCLVFILGLLMTMFAYQTKGEVKTKGGKLEDIVVVAGGESDSLVCTEMFDGAFPVGPIKIDVDKQGNIYILDDVCARIQKYDKDGKWLSSFPIRKKDGRRYTEPIDDIATDNSGNMYATRAHWIMKVSPEGKLLLQSENIPKSEKGYRVRYVGRNISVDSSGRIFNTQGMSSDKVNIYDSELKFLGTIHEFASQYYDVCIAEKEAGDNIYFRGNKYLLRTNLEHYVQSGKIDTVAILPDEITKPKFRDTIPEGYYEPIPFYPLIGFDKYDCLYFYEENGWADEKKYKDNCRGYTVLRYSLNKGKLTKTGKVTIDLQRGEEECSVRALNSFTVDFAVSGDGTIYWLHGTVDTVKVSKIIFDE